MDKTNNSKIKVDYSGC